VVQTGPTIEILDPDQITIAEVTADSGTARTGPSTTYSRLTPLPKGTQARITGREGDWLRLDYGGGNQAWIRASEVTSFASATLPQTVIRSVVSRPVPGWTEVVFPLEVPVPITIRQEVDRLHLILHNTTAQTDTIYVDDDPIIQRLDWHQPEPGEVVYDFQFHTAQQWGYKVRYEGTSLILSLKHPPQGNAASPRIFLDPGHGSVNDLGARGPNGYPEKDVVLIVSKLLQEQLQQRGATVYMAREGDDDLWPHDRVAMIEQVEPDLMVSLHYNALPDHGDALNTQGIGTFWYHAQAHGLAQFLHDYLTQELDRPSYGVFWNNLALTRPSLTPSVLLELGFMIHPEEFEWIVDPEAQVELAQVLAEGILAWIDRQAD
jgi:N-acetylmuramoyl-L-alanine amidase